MATSETRPDFRPGTKARIAAKRERQASFRAAALEAMDVGRPRPRIRDSMEVAVDEALGTVDERAALRSARDPRAVQEAQRALAARKAELRGQQPTASQPVAKKPSLRDQLEAMTDEARDAAVESVTPGTRERRYIEDIVESIRADEDEADFLIAQEDEERALANIDPGGDWSAATEEDDDDGTGLPPPAPAAWVEDDDWSDADYEYAEA